MKKKEEIIQVDRIEVESLELILKKIDFKEDMIINKDALDNEFYQHSEKYKNWQVYLSYCMRDLEIHENKIKLLEATLDKKIRSDKEKKLTETGIKNEILLNPEYQDLLKKINQSKFELNIAKGAVSSMEHKKKALEKAVDLWVFGYNSEPKQKTNIKEKILDATQNKIRGAIKK